MIRLRPLVQGDAPAGIELAGGLTQKTPPCVVVHAAPKEGGPRAARVRRRAGDLTQRQTSFASADSTVYPVDKTLGINAGQGAVFNVAAKTVDEFLNGYNGTVLCMARPVRKTYTFGRPSSNDYEKRGLMPRALEYIFETLTKGRAHRATEEGDPVNRARRSQAQGLLCASRT